MIFRSKIDIYYYFSLKKSIFEHVLTKKVHLGGGRWVLETRVPLAHGSLPWAFFFLVIFYRYFLIDFQTGISKKTDFFSKSIWLLGVFLEALEKLPRRPHELFLLIHVQILNLFCYNMFKYWTVLLIHVQILNFFC